MAGMNTRAHTIFCIAALLIFQNCQKSVPPKPPRDPLARIAYDSTESEVYHALLQRRQASASKLYRKPPVYAVVVDSTIPGLVYASGFEYPTDTSSFSNHIIVRHWPLMAESFIARNALRYCIHEEIFLHKLPVRLLADSLWRRFFFTRPNGGWYDSLYHRFPKGSGLILLSRVGIDSTKHHALVYYEHWLDPMAGIGEFLAFEKIPERGWTVVDSIFTRSW